MRVSVGPGRPRMTDRWPLVVTVAAVPVGPGPWDAAQARWTLHRQRAELRHQIAARTHPEES